MHKSQSAEDAKLPHRIGHPEIIDFLEKCLYNPRITESELRSRVANHREYGSTKQACQLFSLIEITGDIIKLTDIAKEFVLAEKSTRQTILLSKILLGFKHYEIPITNIVTQMDGPSVWTIANFQKYWMIQANVKLARSSLERAAGTLFRFLEYSGIGEYIIGRRGKQTRLEITEEGYNKLLSVIEEKKVSIIQEDTHDINIDDENNNSTEKEQDTMLSNATCFSTPENGKTKTKKQYSGDNLSIEIILTQESLTELESFTEMMKTLFKKNCKEIEVGNND